MWSRGSCRRWFNSSLVLFSQFCSYHPLDESGVFISCTQVFCASLIFRKQSFLLLSMQLLFERFDPSLNKLSFAPNRPRTEFGGNWTSILWNVDKIFYELFRYFLLLENDCGPLFKQTFVSIPKLKILCAKASGLGVYVKNIYRQTDRRRTTGGQKRLTSAQVS